jgi:hypothetical protein
VTQVGIIQLAPRARHGDGRLLAAAQRVRRDRRLVGVVLAPVSEHLAAAQLLLLGAHDQVGQLALQHRGELLGEAVDVLGVVAPVQSGVQVQPLAAARDREGLEAQVLEQLLRVLGDLDALGEACARPGIEVQHEAVRVEVGASRPKPPLRHVDLQRRHLSQPGENSHSVDHHVVVAAAFVLDRRAPDPARRGVRKILLEEHLAGVLGSPDPVHPPLARGRSVDDVGKDVGRDLDVVGDDLGLRRTGGRIDDLVRIGQTQAMTSDGDGLTG